MAHPVRQDPFNNMEAFTASQQQGFDDSGYPNQAQYPAHNGHDAYNQDPSGYMHGRRADHTVTPGADNFSSSAAGGVAGLAYGVADRNAPVGPFDGAYSERLPPPPSQAHMPDVPRSLQAGRNGSHSPQDPFQGASVASSPSPDASYSNLDVQASGNRYQHHTSPVNSGSNFGVMNPNDIVDDGDDGLEYARNAQRGPSQGAAGPPRPARAGPGAGAAAAGAAGGALGQGGDKGGHQLAEYDVHPSGQPGRGGAAAALAQEESSKRRKRWLIILVIFVVIAGGIIGGVVGGLVNNSKHGGKEVSAGSRGGTGAGKGGGNGGGGNGGANGGDLDINSPEIQSLLGNKNLFKVFPGMDYTPQNTQYPDCLADPPSQDDVTKDIAVLSQLTNTVRLYGTDCNQTEMVLYAIDQLKMEDTMRVWLGVWQDNNATTNKRQLDQMWSILDSYGQDPFEGVIVANEAIFREQFTIATLGSLLTDVRTKMKAKSINLPVATSDLGDNWNSALGAESDLIMANIHPFFSGTAADKAAAWTWSFWDDHDGPYFKSNKARNIIAETGWPSGGGTDCGGPSTCTGGAVAGIDEMNQFMDDWVCQALANGTNYFWFEAFDEPWKQSFNTPGMEWEDKWGLMDVDRNLKKGVKIPDCGGKTID
ncbi:putative glucan endo-1 [Escovopsis weberi]|uniref:glucan endo-1,3-beta-D-glucosidase n=1 Tax=Escovopsis weberi TaxID=150374 RepID=A0A0M9VTH0_ESCWE|nr:putative glucan endo-1 [Escovopsis weberi]